MTRLRHIPTLLVLALLPAAGALAADVQSRTSAEILENDGRTTLTLVEAALRISLGQAPILTDDDVIVSWRRAGGIQPTPFRIAIPAGCFVEARNRFRVNATDCGVQISQEDTRLAAESFAARLIPPDPGTGDEPYRLRIRLELTQEAAAAAGLLGTLGGAEVTVRIGTERGVSPAVEIQSKSGIDPTPF